MHYPIFIICPKITSNFMDSHNLPVVTRCCHRTVIPARQCFPLNIHVLSVVLAKKLQ